MDKFARQLLHWFRENGRHDLPWQQETTPYRVWISEIMLQQTQVATVIPYFQRFVIRFPDIETLAQSTIDDVLHQWTGLGYYARGRNLYKTAQIICTDYGGRFPTDIETLKKLPGIGHSTAAAILSLACQQQHAILDGNVKRVLTRYHAIKGWPGKARVERKLWRLAGQHTPDKNVSQYTQAIMDLGATVCIRKKPHCDICPVRKECVARRQGKQQEFPNRKANKSLPVRATVFVMVQNNRRETLLVKRPPCGVWGGLWGFPECKIGTDVKQWALDELGYMVDHCQYWPVMRHTFSHFHQDILPVKLQVHDDITRIKEDKLWCWYRSDIVNPIGMPAPVKNLLEELYEQDSTLRKAG